MQIQNLKFFTYDQNNSGGSFDFDPVRGISTKVIVQARDAEEANYRAERIGLYFDGSGDCSCCGDRWYRQYDQGFDKPMAYSEQSILDWTNGEYFTKWQHSDRPEIYIHLFDGQFMGFVYGDQSNGTLRLINVPELPAGSFHTLEIGS